MQAQVKNRLIHLCVEVQINTPISYRVNRKIGELPQILYPFQGSLFPEENVNKYISHLTSKSLLGHSMVTFVTKIWEFFTFNWSQLLQQTSYQSFRGWCTKYLGWSIHSNPQKINLGQGQGQCPCNARWRLWLRTKVGSASESLQSPISVKCDRVLCQHWYI